MNWYEVLHKALLELGFAQTEADHGVFIKKLQNGGVVIVVVHIDDGLVTRSSKPFINKFKVEMNKKYCQRTLCRYLTNAYTLHMALSLVWCVNGY